ncbi:MAG: signal peptide peptidase SppA [Alcanivoracaceae bacterium]|jgi:protease-4|nr:signal peptide peptidase SppA [Alcanivoracaceae bacterium]
MEEQRPTPPQSSREWHLIEKLVLSMQDEQKKQRRWGNIFKGLTFLYLFALLLLVVIPRGAGNTLSVAEPHTAFVDVTGVIAPDAKASADRIVTGLREAFESDNARAVVLRINSPGGSPVQSSYVYAEIKRLRGEYPDKKLYAVITDIGASGAYYIASAADEIYADPASIVGSIGVIMAGFGFTDAIDKLGVERRVMTAGENKAIMDPFKPVEPGQRAHLQTMLDEIHVQFINAVKEGRGERIDAEQHPEIFSGLFWTGERARSLGLVDGLASPGQVARDVVGEEKIVDYTPRENPWKQLLGDFGASVGAGIAGSIQGPLLK